MPVGHMGCLIEPVLQVHEVTTDRVWTFVICKQDEVTACDKCIEVMHRDAAAVGQAFSNARFLGIDQQLLPAVEDTYSSEGRAWPAWSVHDGHW